MITEIKMPQISMTMLDGAIVKWHRRDGDRVTAGDQLVEIHTDKIVEVLCSSLSGTIQQILAKEGEVVPVGGVLCLVDSDAEASGGTSAPLQNERAHSFEKQAKPHISRRVSPLAKKIAQLEGIDLHGIEGSGPGGLIVKADLPLNTAGSCPKESLSPSAPAPSSFCAPEDIIVPFDRVRRRIADNLMLSKRSAAEVTTVADVNMGAIKDIRSILPLSYTAFIVAATAKALKEYTSLNALVEEDQIILKNKININVAVATDSGLLTPVITNAGEKNPMTIAEDLADLADRGRGGKLKLQDFENGTFTITNSGIYGSLFFTPILNHPQSAVLGIGRIAMTPIVKEEKIVAAPMMYLSLTYNHRAIDGETAVKFLQRVKYYLETPTELLAVKGNER